MNDKWTDRLSEYLDAELDNEERVALEAHLATCGDCRATLEDLRRVVGRARALEDRAPRTDLWAGIAKQIRHEHVPDVRDRLVRRRLSLTVGQLLAASVALVMLAGGSVWLALQGREQGDIAVTSSASPSNGIQASSGGRGWRARTDMAVAELEEALVANEGQLDTATVRVLRQSLASIDRAIAQAQRALRRDPGNAYLNLHLANTMRQKIELLRRANALVTSES